MLEAVIMTAQPADREPPSSQPANPRSRPPLTVSAGAVQAVFTWAGDRWRHVVLVDGRPWAASLEGRADDRDAAWPCSPPLVELTSTATPRGEAILGVGLAGRSHFSASVAPAPDLPDTLVFEIACRIREQPGWLGSTYERGGERVLVTAPQAAAGLPATVRWTYAVDRGGVRPLPPATLSRGG
jgi:hypothetical protein